MSERTETPQATIQAPPAQAAPSGPAGGGAPAPAPAPKRKPPVVLLAIFGVALVIGGIFGAKWWIHHQAYVSTDDAQVAGDLVTVSPRVPGHIAQLMVDEGQSVKADQVIAKLDDTDFKAQVATAQATLAVAKSNLASSQTGVTLQSSTSDAQIAQAQATVATAEAGVRTARAGLATARVNARKADDDAVRTRRLYKVGGISRQQLDAADAAAAAADSGVAQANAQVASAEGQLQNARQSVALAQANTQQVEIKKGGVQTVQAQIQQAQAQLDAAQLQLAHATIYAPANGIVARRMVNVGEQVQPGQGLFSIAKTDNIWILAYVEETAIRRVHQGAPVDVHIDAYPNDTFKGTVSLVNVVTGSSFSLMPQNNASGNYTKVVQRIPIKVAVEDPNHMLKPGMSAVIDIDARSQNAPR